MEYGLSKICLTVLGNKNIRVSEIAFQQAHLTVHMSVSDPSSW